MLVLVLERMNKTMSAENNGVGIWNVITRNSFVRIHLFPIQGTLSQLITSNGKEDKFLFRATQTKPDKVSRTCFD